MQGLIQQGMTGEDAQMAPPMGAPAALPNASGMGAPGQPSPGGAPPDSGDYQKALEFAMRGLYEGEIAVDIARQLSETEDPPASMADAAYQVVQIADEQVGGVPDEDLVPLATEVLGEIAEIAEASGVQVRPRDVSAAMRQMTLRFAREMGGDTSALEQAMSQVSDDEIEIASQGDMLDEEPAIQAPEAASSQLPAPSELPAQGPSDVNVPNLSGGMVAREMQR